MSEHTDEQLKLSLDWYHRWVPGDTRPYHLKHKCFPAVLLTVARSSVEASCYWTPALLPECMALQ